MLNYVKAAYLASRLTLFNSSHSTPTTLDHYLLVYRLSVLWLEVSFVAMMIFLGVN